MYNFIFCFVFYFGLVCFVLFCFVLLWFGLICCAVLCCALLCFASWLGNNEYNIIVLLPVLQYLPILSICYVDISFLSTKRVSAGGVVFFTDRIESIMQNLILIHDGNCY